VIFTCTWTVQHLNVPEQREERDPGFKGDVKWSLKGFWTSTKWMCITILAPEALVSLNLGQLVDAMATTAEIRSFAEEDHVPWTLTHSLFANMGGFVIRENEPERAGAACQCGHLGPALQSKEEVKTGAQTESICVEGVAQLASVIPPAKEEQLEMGVEVQAKTGKITFVLASEIWTLRKRRIIRLPYITKEEIMDKSKSDNFARLLAIGQTLWLVVQMIVRASRHLEVSQLEIGTAAFVSCAIMIYALNWHKPKGVGVPWTIWTFPGPFPNQLETVLLPKLENDWFITSLLPLSLSTRTEHRSSLVPNHHRYMPYTTSRDTGDWEFWCLLLSMTLIGAIHFAAIKATFPSHIEKLLWLIASSVCTGFPLLWVFIVVLDKLSRSIARFTKHLRVRDYSVLFLAILLTCGLPLLYVAARVFIIVELFRSLFFLPPSAFVATWASNIPHIS